MLVKQKTKKILPAVEYLFTSPQSLQYRFTKICTRALQRGMEAHRLPNPEISELPETGHYVEQQKY
jgi:hypothetical protein